MSKWYDSKEFKALKKQWYDKLKDNDFEDIEYDENNLKQYDSSFLARHDINRVGPRAEYYRLAGNFLHDHKFKSERDKQIWALHSAGLSITAIADKLKGLHKAVSKSPIHVTITTLAKEMLKKYAKQK